MRAFRDELARVRRRRRFIPVRQTGAFARELRELLALLEPDLDPGLGVGQVAAFIRADARIFEACDDSNGSVGDVFRMDARDRFVHYASRWEDKEALAGLVFDLLEDDGYGVRDTLLEVAAQYLPESSLRALADREWNAAGVVAIERGFEQEFARRHRYIYVELIARQLDDPRLFERARRAYDPKLGTASCIAIARSWLLAGEASVALEWLQRVGAGEHFMADERETLLADVHRRLGNDRELRSLLTARFHAFRSVPRLEALLEVIGADQRDRVVAEAAENIQRSGEFASADAGFLLDCGRNGDAARYVIERRALVDGDYWGGLVPLANALEGAGQPLAATIIYRALLDSILARAQTRTYGHGARYLRRLGQLAGAIERWGDVVPHDDYVASLREKHARKSSFWGRVP